MSIKVRISTNRDFIQITHLLQNIVNATEHFYMFTTLVVYIRAPFKVIFHVERMLEENSLISMDVILVLITSQYKKFYRIDCFLFKLYTA